MALIVSIYGPIDFVASTLQAINLGGILYLRSRDADKLGMESYDDRPRADHFTCTMIALSSR